LGPRVRELIHFQHSFQRLKASSRGRVYITPGVSPFRHTENYSSFFQKIQGGVYTPQINFPFQTHVGGLPGELQAISNKSLQDALGHLYDRRIYLFPSPQVFHAFVGISHPKKSRQMVFFFYTPHMRERGDSTTHTVWLLSLCGAARRGENYSNISAPPGFHTKFSSRRVDVHTQSKDVRTPPHILLYRGGSKHI